MQVVVGGILEEIKPIITKKNEPMAFIRIADLSGSIEAVVFPRIFTEQKDLLFPEACIAIKGRVSKRNGETSIIVEKIRKLEPAEK
jgi:DNA polymerase-3 subunit alpha